MAAFNPIENRSMPSLKELAKIVGVSPTTVSFVLNGRSKEMRISQELSDKIMQTAKDMSYKPNNIAVALRTGQTKIIGLIVEDIGNSFFSNLAKTIEVEANYYGYKLVYCSTENDDKKGQELINMLSQQRVDGYLIAPTLGMQENIKGLIKAGMPLVLIDRYFEKITCPYVVVNNFDGIVNGVSHLIKKGYQKIGFVTVDSKLIQMTDRQNAFIETMKAHKLLKSRQQILQLEFSDSKADAVEKIKVFLRAEKPDAVVFATNYVGISGLQAVKELKLRIPDDLAVVCFDDNELFDLCTPTITAIQQPVEEIAKAAVKILMGELGVIKKSAKKQIRIPTKMIYRESV
jgi:LacI family transcriptional regulator